MIGLQGCWGIELLFWKLPADTGGFLIRCLAALPDSRRNGATLSDIVLYDREMVAPLCPWKWPPSYPKGWGGPALIPSLASLLPPNTSSVIEILEMYVPFRASRCVDLGGAKHKVL